MFKKTTGEQIGEITEEIAVLSESDRSDWTTEFCKISWKGKDAKHEIRKMNKHTDEGVKFGKGVALDEEELNILALSLIENGFGDTKELKIALKNRE